jgi:hydroxyacylglutathione hydrolase
MYVRRFFEPSLAQASYLIGCQSAREAIVIDPNRDVAQYLADAEAAGLEIRSVTETHIHADFVSGGRELARSAGATLYLSDEGDEAWKYGFAGDGNVTLVRHGDRITVGNVRIDVLHTPGHTPEHLTFLVTDGAAADEPIAAATGDFIFVGDVGRPDLLERAAAIKGTMESSARTLYRSLQTFAARPDWLQIWPGHGAGSACGKGLSAIPHSTVGYERRFNWAFDVKDEAEFARLVLAGQPDPPKYFGAMKRINREGPGLLGGLPRPVPAEPEAIVGVMERGALVVDTRTGAEYASGHIPGTINIPFNNAFTTWAGWLVPYDRDVYLLSAKADGRQAEGALRDLAMIGLDRIAGSFGAEALGAWTHTGRGLTTVARITARELADRMRRGAAAVVDVRTRAEWEAGHIPGVPNIPASEIVARIGELPEARPLVVHCQGGTRSTIAASLLDAQGLTDVMDFPGGFTDWEREGLPVTAPAGEIADLVLGPAARATQPSS